jgi:hypothetical protein
MSAAPDHEREQWLAAVALDRAHCRWLRELAIANGSIVPADPNVPDRRGDRIVAALGLRVLTLAGPSRPPRPGAELPRGPVGLPEEDPWQHPGMRWRPQDDDR